MLEDVGDDILRTLFGLLANPLEPVLAVPLACCCKSVLKRMISELKWLLDQHQNARHLCSLVRLTGWNAARKCDCEALRSARKIHLQIIADRAQASFALQQLISSGGADRAAQTLQYLARGPAHLTYVRHCAQRWRTWSRST